MTPEQINEIIGLLAPKIAEELTKRFGVEVGPLLNGFMQQVSGATNGPVSVRRVDPETGKHILMETNRPQLMAEQIDEMIYLSGAIDQLNENVEDLLEMAEEQKPRRKRKAANDED